ncbi:MAG: site-specific DNA-methyltransferase [Bacteroides sp.]|nr:site-specific DNA-methyltransferase [Bacteroides sp.]
MVQIPTLFLFIRRRGVLATLVQPFTIAMNKTELARKIQALDGLDNEEKTALLELLRKQKKYGLVWEEKSEDIEERLRDELPILVERNDEKVHPIISDNPDAPNHLIIEGDNLAALTELSYTHAGKIDVIYIDPPYNTGSKEREGGFFYNDDFIDFDNEYFHSKWLCFMSKRLKIALKLLSERGVIFISIDDNEQANLKILCDEVFGKNNFVGTYFWKRTSTPPALSYKIRRKLEYVICYQKTNIPQRSFAQGYIDGGDVPLLNSGNPEGMLNFPIGTVRFNLPDGTYTHSSSYKIRLVDDVVVKDGRNINAFRAIGHFKWGQANLEREVSEGTYFLIKSRQFSPRFQKATRATKVPSNIIDEEVGVGTNEDAQKEMDHLNMSFSYAKPSSLVKFLIKMPFWEEKNIAVLDFFAGSGTTLQAVMDLNLEDNGKRQCILCQREDQIPGIDSFICSGITYERNRRLIEEFVNADNVVTNIYSDNNLRYYRTEFLPRERSVKNMRELVKASTGLLCIKNDLYTEAPFGGRKMNSRYARYFEHGEKRMLVIYDERTIPLIVDIVKSLPEGEKIKVYVFSYGSYSYEDEFAEVENQVELCALPQAIYDAYQKVLPKRKPKFIVDDLVSEIEESESIEVQGTFDFDYEETEKGGDE